MRLANNWVPPEKRVILDKLTHYRGGRIFSDSFPLSCNKFNRVERARNEMIVFSYQMCKAKGYLSSRQLGPHQRQDFLIGVGTLPGGFRDPIERERVE